jgi:hypothetical protein
MLGSRMVRSAVWFWGASIMDIKERLTEKLQKIEVVEGVLPTRPERSPSLTRMAQDLRVDDLHGAEHSAIDNLKQLHPQLPNMPATILFSDSRTLREQVAGFAAAGFNLFHASKELVEAPLSARRKAGGNDMVSRVLISNQRLLLETPRIVLRFQPTTSAQERAAVLKKYGLDELPGAGGLPPDTMIAVLSKGGEATKQSIALMTDSAVAYAEPDFLEHIGHRYKPTDPEFVNQWHHQNIKCQQAWDVTKGAGVSIAVIDNGFDTSHQDLQFGPLSAWFRPTPDHVDADFVPGTVGMASANHGTACAGMLAAKENNNFGGCGVAFDANLSMIACANDQVSTQSTLARALAYAAAPDLEPGSRKTRSEGADIIVSSLGPSSSAVWEIRQVMSDALDFAATQGRQGKGCAIFWACTNGNYPISSDEVCSHQRVSAVGRSRSDDGDDGSGFGVQLDFLAPGVDVFIPSAGNRYRTTTGTSFAAPCAAGVAALALSVNKSMTADELRQLIRDTCDKVGLLPYIKGRNARFGNGRVNAEAAVDEARRRAPTS